MKKAGVLITAVLVLFSGAVPAFAAQNTATDGLPEYTSVSQYRIQEGSSEEKLIQTMTSFYDERGLLTSIGVESPENPDESGRVEVQYSFDRIGNPERISMDYDGEALEFVISNSYESGILGLQKVTEAVITDVLDNGNSVLEFAKDQDLKNMNTSLAAILQIPFSCIRYYTGYQNTVFRLGETEMEYRFENGRLVYSAVYQPGMLETTTMRYMSDGILTSTTFRNYHADGSSETLTTTTETDSRNCIISYNMVSDGANGQTEDTVSIQYNKKLEEKTGRVYLEGTAGNGSVDMAEMFGSLRYYLDDDGNVIQEQIENVRQRSVTDYDAGGRMIRQERYIPDVLRIVNDYHYR